MAAYASGTTSLIVVSVIFPLLAALSVIVRFRIRSKSPWSFLSAESVILVALVYGTYAYKSIESKTNLLRSLQSQMVLRTLQALSLVVLAMALILPNWLWTKSPCKQKYAENSHLRVKWCLQTCKVLFAFQFYVTFSVALVKISLVLFYKQIFATQRFKTAANILIGIILAWLIAFFLTTLFQAWPISTNWTGVGTMIMNEGAMYIASCVTDIILDIAVLCMPLPMIKSLNLSTKKKWNLVGIFWLGAL